MDSQPVSQPPSQPVSEPVAEHDSTDLLIGRQQLSAFLNRDIETASQTLAFCSSAISQVAYCFNGSRTHVLSTRRVRIGKGATCSVYKTLLETTLPGGQTKTEAVAIKHKRDISLASWLISVTRDIRIMSHRALKDSNIVHALGYIWEEIEEHGEKVASPCIMMPLAEGGRTLQHWFDSGGVSWLSSVAPSVRALAEVAFARDLANGLLALHQCGIIHGDIKSQNVLVFDDGSTIPKLKMTDFSHSVIVSDYAGSLSRWMPRYTGTRPFLIPEVRREDRLLSQESTESYVRSTINDYYACDVFSLGNLICTLINEGLDLYSRVRNRLEDQGVDNGDDAVEYEVERLFQQPLGVLDEALQSSMKSWSWLSGESNVGAIMVKGKVQRSLEQCLQDDPHKRASAWEVAENLNLGIVVVRGSGVFSPKQPTERRPIRSIASLSGPLYWLTQELHLALPPRLADLIRRQIVRELLRAQSNLAREETAAAIALGFGLKRDIEMAARFLDLVSFKEIPFPPSVLLREWISSAMNLSHMSQLKLDDARYLAPGLYSTFSDALTPTYTERVRSCKLSSGEYATSQGSVLGLRPSQSTSAAIFKPPEQPLERFQRLFGDEGELKMRISLRTRRNSVAEDVASCAYASTGLSGEVSRRRANSLEEATLRKSLKVYQNYERLDRLKDVEYVASQGSNMSEIELRRRRLFSLFGLRALEPQMADSLVPSGDIQSTFGDVMEVMNSRKRMIQVANSLQIPNNLDSGQLAGPSNLLQVAVDYMDHDCSFLAQAKAMECIRAVIETAKDESVHARISGGEAALAYAVRRGQALAARALLRYGADPRQADDNGVTALHWLPLLQDDEMGIVARALVSHGADVDARTTDGVTLPEHLIRLEPGATPLHFAVAMKSLHAVRLLIELGTDQSLSILCLHGWRAFYSMTPLHLAISLHFAEIVTFLLEKGKSTSVYIQYTYLPLHPDQEEQFENTGQVHIVNLVTMCPYELSNLAPFFRIVTHGSMYVKAVVETLAPLAKRFPERDVLDSEAMLYGSPDEPYIWLALQLSGFRPSEASLPSMSIPEGLSECDRTAYRSVMFWLWCARSASWYRLAARDASRAALGVLDSAKIQLSRSDRLVALEAVVRDGVHGMLAELLGRRELWVEEEEFAYLFWLAASYGDVNCMEEIWNLVVDVADEGSGIQEQMVQYTRDGFSALHQAVRSNNPDALAFLLLHGWNIDTDLEPVGTALCLAVDTPACKDAAIHLLGAGASLRCNRGRGQDYTILHAAASASPNPLLKDLDRTAQLMRTMMAAQPDAFFGTRTPGGELVGRILDCRDSQDETFFDAAIRTGNADMVELAIEIGYDIDQPDESGFTPLLKALVFLYFDFEHLIHMAMGLAGASGESQNMAQESEDGEKNGNEQDNERAMPEAEKERLLARAWRESRLQRIIDMLLKAGARDLDREPSTGDYRSLLVEAAGLFLNLINNAAFSDMDNEPTESIFKEIYRHFGFWKKPNHEVSAARLAVTICPNGDDGPVLAYERGEGGEIRTIRDF